MLQHAAATRGSCGLDPDDVGYAHALAARLGIRLGDGVTLLHFDEGWSLDHPVFARFLAGGGQIEHLGGGAIDSGRRSHGTSTLALQIGALDGEPLLPGARVLLVRALDDDEHPTAVALTRALTSCRGVGVCLLARDWSSRAPHIPLELRPGMGEAFAIAIRRGVTMVEAAGNGGVDLDSLQRRDGAAVRGQICVAGDPWILPDDRLSAAFTCDSGAIVVGAATAGSPARRWTAGFRTNPQPRSNYGSRIDCWATGAGIATAATDASGQPVWDAEFGGTSAASAIVAAVIAVLQSLALHWPGRRRAFAPAELRRLLRASTLGDPVCEGDRVIGTRPRLRSILDDALGVESTTFGHRSLGSTG